MKKVNSKRAKDADAQQLILDIITEVENIPDPDFREEIVEWLRERLDEATYQHLFDVGRSQSIRACSLLEPARDVGENLEPTGDVVNQQGLPDGELAGLGQPAEETVGVPRCHAFQCRSKAKVTFFSSSFLCNCCFSPFVFFF